MANTFIVTIVLALFSLAAAANLGSYGGDRTQVSVSGMSAGAFFATQYHVIHSSKVMGAGVIAGGPFWCARGNLMTALGACMTSPNSIDNGRLFDQTATYAGNSQIDPVDNLQNDKVWLFAGSSDSTVVPGVVSKAEEYYHNYVNPGNIVSMIAEIDAHHNFPTEDYGNLCTLSYTPYIGKCNYNAAYELLNHIYGDLKKPDASTQLLGDFIEFDATEFFAGLTSLNSMDDNGYAYIPSGCRHTAGCKVHMAFHGCLQGKHAVGDVYAKNTGYNEVAELNNIIIIYPQATSSMMLGNLNGCFDWWGYTAMTTYATNSAVQIQIVDRMLERVLSSDVEPCRNN